MKRLILALILLVVVLITGCADAGRRDQDKKSVHSPAVTLGIERIGEYEQLFAGKRVGLITNQTGVDSKLRSSERDFCAGAWFVRRRGCRRRCGRR